MNIGLFITSIIILLCILLNRVSRKIGIPMLLGFILLGMLFGSDGILKIPFENYIKIDNSNLSPDVVAKMIQEKFNL